MQSRYEATGANGHSNGGGNILLKLAGGIVAVVVVLWAVYGLWYLALDRSSAPERTFHLGGEGAIATAAPYYDNDGTQNKTYTPQFAETAPHVASGSAAVLPGGQTNFQPIRGTYVANHADEFIGQAVTLYGNVVHILSPRAYILDTALWLGQAPILVFKTGVVSPDPEEQRDQRIQVSGTIKTFDLAAMEKEAGEPLDKALYEKYDGKPVLVVSSRASL